MSGGQCVVWLAPPTYPPREGLRDRVCGFAYRLISPSEKTAGVGSELYQTCGACDLQRAAHFTSEAYHIRQRFQSPPRLNSHHGVTA